MAVSVLRACSQSATLFVNLPHAFFGGDLRNIGGGLPDCERECATHRRRVPGVTSGGDQRRRVVNCDVESRVNFGGRLEAQPWNLASGTGQDALGSFQQISFSYSPAGGTRAAAIRLYDTRPLAIFTLNYVDASANTNPFPVISTYPVLSHLSFFGEFASPQFTNLSADSPWAFFDSSGNTYIVSPAQNYLLAATSRDAKQEIVTGIDPAISYLPAGFTHATALAWGQGINRTFQSWGNALTDLTGKHRPPNDLDALLDTLSYWTDNGATYYYNPGGSSYSITLMGARAELEAKGIRLGALQLDSWWYPKGPDNSWSSHGGLWDFVAAPGLFQPDLKTFSTNLGVPLVAHSRWIDVNSPLRSKYTMSGGVSTDPAYWRDIAAYLKSNGVGTFEQDWLGDAAHPNYNLTDPNLFFDGMAAAMDAQGLTMQYWHGAAQAFPAERKLFESHYCPHQSGRLWPRALERFSLRVHICLCTWSLATRRRPDEPAPLGPEAGNPLGRPTGHRRRLGQHCRWQRAARGPAGWRDC